MNNIGYQDSLNSQHHGEYISLPHLKQENQAAIYSTPQPYNYLHDQQVFQDYTKTQINNFSPVNDEGNKNYPPNTSGIYPMTDMNHSSNVQSTYSTATIQDMDSLPNTHHFMPVQTHQQIVNFSSQSGT